MTKKYKFQPHVYEYIWVLDASSGDVVRIEIPPNFPENGDHEGLIIQAFEDEGEGRRLKDCDWMLGKASPEYIYVLQGCRSNNGTGPARDPPTEGKSILVFSEFFLTLGLQMVDIYSILKE